MAACAISEWTYTHDLKDSNNNKIGQRASNYIVFKQATLLHDLKLNEYRALTGFV